MTPEPIESVVDATREGETFNTAVQHSRVELNDFVPVLYKRRWFVLGGYCLLSISSLSVWFAFSSISNITRKYYNIDTLQVSWLASVFSIIPIVFMFPSNWFLRKKGLGLTIILAGFLNAFGSCIRYIGLSSSSYGYLFLLVGSVFCAVSISAFLFLPAKIAALWFGEKERATAVSIAISADSVGLALGYFMPTAMVKNRSNISEIGDDLFNYLLAVAILATLSFIYVTVTVRDKPKTAPSFSEAQKDEPAKDFLEIIDENNHAEELISGNDVIHLTEIPSSAPIIVHQTDNESGFKILLKNIHFQKLLHLHGIIFGLESVYLIALNEMLIPQFPGHEFEVGLMGAVSLLLSVPSTYVIGLLIDKTRAYKKITIGTTCLLTILTSVLTTFFYLRLSFYSLFCTYTMIVIVFATYYTTAFDHTAELTYPVSEAHSGVVLLWFAQLYSLVFGRAASYILVHSGANVLMIFILILNSLTFVISLFVKDKGPRGILKAIDIQV